MAGLMRQRDWKSTPLGDPAGWPDALKIPLKMLLTSRFEMWLGWGPDLSFFYNDAYIPTLGLKHPSMLGKPFKQVWAEVYDDVADQVARVRDGEATWNKALLLLLERSGYPEETYHSFSYSPLYGTGGAVEGLLCVVSEDTERVISERRIDMLRQLGMRMVGNIDQQSVIEAAFSVLNFNRRDFPFALLYLENEARAWSADAGRLIDHPWPLEQAASSDIRKLPLSAAMDWPTGAWKRPPAEALVVPIPGAGGRRVFGSLVLGLNPHRPDDPHIMDIARLVAGQIGGALANIDVLQSERRRADRIWSYSRDLLVVIGADGILRSVSPAWTRILGHAADIVVGRHLRDFVFADDLTSTTEAFERATRNADLTAFENRLVGSDGKTRWFSWHTSTEQDLVYSYGRDITEQKDNAAALAATEAALRQAQKMEAVGQLTGGIAHDFNNLLTGIIGSLEMMKRRAGEGRTVDADRYVTAASAAAHRAAALTQRLLAFSRRQPLDSKTIDVNGLVDDMAELIRRSIGESIELDFEVGPNLWFAKCDANQLESAVLNLAINARDAMPQGGRLTIRTANIHVDAEDAARSRIPAAGDFVMISVADTGHGMTADVREKAFEPFFTTKPMGQGTGLGLSMIYGFVRQSGGFIDLNSEEGKGTTVRLYLPRSEAAQRKNDRADIENPVNRTDRNGTILVVEDEAAVRAIVVDALRDAGYRILEAGDGATGLKFLQGSARIDLLVSDVGLPGGLNGRQLADAARVLRPNLRVLFMTAYAHNAKVGAGSLEAGMELIAKPFEIDTLIDRVCRMIDEAP
ncbi:response regulator [Undibacter mobilis]|uniref:histidine kinase n=2 Tax=Undibacter mobilis TaxID=2292256 RepID=A0A371BDL0_9BRAD|nr:response regulator [Undibacter mobilis]